MTSSETGSGTTMKSSGTSSETQAKKFGNRFGNTIKSSGTSSEKTKKVRKQQDLVRRKPYKVRRKVSNNNKNMLVFPL